jgi:hypothetical protein
MLHKLLRALQTREAEIAEHDAGIRRQIEPFRKAMLAWRQVPGIDEVTTCRAVRRLTALGYKVHLEQAASAPA